MYLIHLQEKILKNAFEELLISSSGNSTDSSDVVVFSDNFEQLMMKKQEIKDENELLFLVFQNLPKQNIKTINKKNYFFMIEIALKLLKIKFGG